MRGHHTRYIALVNEACPAYYVKTGKKRWKSTIDMQFLMGDGTVVTVPAGTEWDMFSCVPDTDYLEFQKSSLLHDWLRRNSNTYKRFEADHCFSYDMTQRIQNIRNILMTTDCDKDVVHTEIIRLDRVAAVYTLGVSGKLGSLFIKLDKLSKWF